MGSNDLLRQRILSKLVAQHGGRVIERAIQLWELFALELVPIIGTEGFTILYGRSLDLTQGRFPWLTNDSKPPLSESRFATLKACLDQQDLNQADKANKALLFTFTELLADMIGEQLTINILRTAWGDDVADGDGTKPSAVQLLLIEKKITRNPHHE